MQSSNSRRDFPESVLIPASVPSLAQRIARYSAALLLIFILTIGASSWWLIRGEQLRAYHQLINKEIELHANRVSTRLQTVHNQIAQAAASSLISTALVDSAGKDAYLVPYLQGLQRVEGIPVSLVFVDFEGKEIARNGAAGIGEQHFAWVNRVLNDPSYASATVMGSGDGAELVGAERIFYSRTKMPEGALLYRMKLSDLAEPSAPLHWRGDGFVPSADTWWQTLKVPEPLQPLGLSLVLRESATVPGRGIELMLVYLGGTAFAMLLAVWASRRLGRLMTQDLQHLSDFAGAVVEQGFGSERARLKGTREITLLADAINSMLNRLNQQHRLLQEESEAKLRNLVENIPGAAYRCRIDTDWTMEYCSRGIQELTGYPASDFVDGAIRTYTSIIEPDDRATRQAFSGQSVHESKYRIRHANGQTRWIWERSRAGHDSQGRAVYLEGLLFDITDLKQAERMKNEFVSTVSHELRTPLTSIYGSLELLQSGLLGKLPDDAVDLIQMAFANSLRLKSLIDDLLDMEKMAAGKFRFEMARQALMPLVDQTLAANQSYAGQNQVRLVLAARLDDAWVRVDGQRLIQALTNLISNAAKFSPAAEQVTVAVQRISDRLRITVNDHGPGIPLEFRKHIFEKFTQADSSNTREKGGTGLGLAITRELVTGMSGTIGFESTPGQGTTFYIDLPECIPVQQDSADHVDCPNA